MADHQQLQRLQRSVQEWNEWRREHPESIPDLSNAPLSDIDLTSVNLRKADLSKANLSHTNLTDANLSEAFLNRAILIKANLRKVDLSGTMLIDTFLTDANLSEAFLNRADLSNATLVGADLNRADLSNATLNGTTLINANLSEADLSDAFLNRADLSRALLIGAKLLGADLSRADLSSTDLSRAIMSDTTFGNRDFRLIKGLETVTHQGPSPLSINSLYLSEGEIPESFVRGTGAPDTFIEYMRSLVAKPIDYYTCFISYSSKDQEFVERLYADLQHKGVRCWFAPEDLKIGDKFRTRIDESIRVHDKLLLVLSEHSVNSAWVEKEVETAFEKEHRSNKLVLFPIKLDDMVMHTDEAWAADIRRMRHIGDMARWKDHDAYQRGLQRLLRDLKQEKM